MRNNNLLQMCLPFLYKFIYLFEWLVGISHHVPQVGQSACSIINLLTVKLAPSEDNFRIKY